MVNRRSFLLAIPVVGLVGGVKYSDTVTIGNYDGLDYIRQKGRLDFRELGEPVYLGKTLEGEELWTRDISREMREYAKEYYDRS